MHVTWLQHHHAIFIAALQASARIALPNWLTKPQHHDSNSKVASNLTKPPQIILLTTAYKNQTPRIPPDTSILWGNPISSKSNHSPSTPNTMNSLSPTNPSQIAPVPGLYISELRPPLSTSTLKAPLPFTSTLLTYIYTSASRRPRPPPSSESMALRTCSASWRRGIDRIYRGNWVLSIGLLCWRMRCGRICWGCWARRWGLWRGS